MDGDGSEWRFNAVDLGNGDALYGVAVGESQDHDAGGPGGLNVAVDGGRNHAGISRRGVGNQEGESTLPDKRSGPVEGTPERGVEQPLEFRDAAGIPGTGQR